MSTKTDQLIDRLATEVKPVKRLQSPWKRAALWLALVVVVSAIYIWNRIDLSNFMDQTLSLRLKIEWLATALTGMSGICAAFYLSIPGRSPRWTYVPVLPLVLWLSLSTIGCLKGINRQGLELGISPHCFKFILVTSLPLGLFLFWRLRVAQPLASMQVAFTGGLGIAGCAAAILQFVHPFDITLIDLLVHSLAVACVVGASIALRRWYCAESHSSSL